MNALFCGDGVHTVSTSFLPISYNNRIFAALMNKMKAKLLLIVSFFLLLSQTLVAQEQDTVQRKKTRINILHYDKATYSKSMGDVQRLIGNVKMRHDSAYFFCDSAYYYQKNNSFDAYQNVHIIVNDSVEIFSDLLNYDGDRRFAEFHDNVHLRDDSTNLYTEYLTYDRNLHLASYPDSATTVRGDKTLKSHYGYYRDRLKEFSFFENVEVYSPKYQMYTDTLFYNTGIEKMWFEGPTTIINKENILEGKHGYYLVNEDFVYLDKRPYMHNETQQMRADSIFYDRNKGLAQAYNQVDMIDTSYQVIMRGDYVEMWENKGFSFATDSAYAISYDGGDSLYIHGDTLYMYFDKEKEEAEKLIARRNVRFFKSDMQGKCDTLTYLKADSIIQMRVAPILWAEDSQLTGVDIDIKLKDHNVDWVLQKGNAFIISKDSIEGYNQIKGKDITSSTCRTLQPWSSRWKSKVFPSSSRSKKSTRPCILRKTLVRATDIYPDSSGTTRPDPRTSTTSSAVSKWRCPKWRRHLRRLRKRLLLKRKSKKRSRRSTDQEKKTTIDYVKSKI